MTSEVFPVDTVISDTFTPEIPTFPVLKLDFDSLGQGSK